MRGDRSIYLDQFSMSCSKTLFVAISNCHPGPVFMQADSTNSEDLMKFLRLLLRQRSDFYQRSQPLWVVLDGKEAPNRSSKLTATNQTFLIGHTAHRCEKNGVLQLLRSQTVIKPWFTPRAASWFNSAEWVNSHVKRKLSKVFALYERDVRTKKGFE